MGKQLGLTEEERTYNLHQELKRGKEDGVNFIYWCETCKSMLKKKKLDR